MIQKIKKLMAVGMTSFLLMVPTVAVPALGGIAAASITSSVCDGSKAASQEGGSCTNSNLDDTGGSIQTLARQIVNIFSIIIGAIAIIMLLYGGLRYITSGGDSGRVGNAKNTLLYAIIGLVVVALAQIIVNFVLSTANSAGNEFVN